MFETHGKSYLCVKTNNKDRTEYRSDIVPLHFLYVKTMCNEAAALPLALLRNIIEEVVFAFAIVMNEYIHIKRSFIETEVYVICESA